MIETKLCNKCDIIKEIEEFYDNKNSCKECIISYVKSKYVKKIVNFSSDEEIEDNEKLCQMCLKIKSNTEFYCNNFGRFFRNCILCESIIKKEKYEEKMKYEEKIICECGKKIFKKNKEKHKLSIYHTKRINN